MSLRGTGSDLSGLAAGDPLVVQDSQERYHHRKVAKVARVWLTDDQGDRFRIADGEGEERHQIGHGFYAMTVADWEDSEERERLRGRLAEWGWVLSLGGRKLTLPQLRRAAALLAEFESESTGGLL
jgi:hypothetical protein